MIDARVHFQEKLEKLEKNFLMFGFDVNTKWLSRRSSYLCRVPLWSGVYFYHLDWRRIGNFGMVLPMLMEMTTLRG